MIGAEQHYQNWKIKSDVYYEHEKRKISEKLNSIFKSIKANTEDIQELSEFKVDFIPVKNKAKQFMPGTFVIRIKIPYGNRSTLYSFESS